MSLIQPPAGTNERRFSPTHESIEWNGMVFRGGSGWDHYVYFDSKTNVLRFTVFQKPTLDRIIVEVKRGGSIVKTGDFNPAGAIQDGDGQGKKLTLDLSGQNDGAGSTITLVIKPYTQRDHPGYLSTADVKMPSKISTPTVTNKDVTGGVEFTWPKVSGASGYVYREKGSQSWINTQGESVTVSVPSGSSYEYEFKTLNSNSYDLDSDVVLVSGFAKGKLPPPSGVIVSGVDNEQMKLHWTDNPFAIGFQVQVKDSNGNVLKTIDLPAGTTEYEITGLEKNTDYIVGVKALSTDPVDNSELASITVKTANADRDLPVITLRGNAHILIKKGTSFFDQGATATDATEGDLTSKIVTTGTVDINVDGDYSLSYDVQDAAGNKAVTVVRTVSVREDSIIKIIGTDAILDLNEPYVERGADGFNDLGEPTNVEIDASKVDVTTPGEYFVTYKIPAGPNVYKEVIATRKVTIRYPKGSVGFDIVGPEVIRLPFGTPYVEEGVERVIRDDGLVGSPSDVKIEGSVPTSKAGRFIVTYTYTALKSGAKDDIIKQRYIFVKKIFKGEKELQEWLEGDVLYHKETVGTTYDENVDKVRIVKPNEPKKNAAYRLSAYYDQTALDPYERKIVAETWDGEYIDEDFI